MGGTCGFELENDEVVRNHVKSFAEIGHHGINLGISDVRFKSIFFHTISDFMDQIKAQKNSIIHL